MTRARRLVLMAPGRLPVTPPRGLVPFPVLVLLLTAGCAAPAPEAPTARVIVGGGRLLELKPPRAQGGLISYGVYDPRSGRMSRELAARHHLRPYLPPGRGEPATVFAAGFDELAGAADLDWLRLGDPLLEIKGRAGANRFLRVSSHGERPVSGIAKHLYAAPFVGKTLVCQVRTRLGDRSDGRRSPAPTASAAVPGGQPVVRFVILVEGGRELAVTWPLAWRPTPGWETQRVVWAAPPDLLAVRLEVLLPPGDLVADFDDFLVYDPQALELAGPNPDPDLIPQAPRPGRNLLPGGSFEVGQKSFGLLAYEPVPDPARPDRAITRAVAAAWYFEQPGYMGHTCLAVPLNTRPSTAPGRPAPAPATSEKVRLWLGPVTLERPAVYVVSLALRATQPMPVEVALWVGGEEVGRARLTVNESWRRLAHSFLAMGRHVPGEAYVLIEAARRPAESPIGLWLDAVSLTPAVPPGEYQPPNQVELGILGPAGDPLDVGHLIHQARPVEFKVRLVNYDRRAFVGQVCLDVVDALDRVVWTTDLRCKLGPRGYANDTLDSAHQLRLHRGYYRILATAWLGAKGNTEPLSQAARPFAVINLDDPLPAGAPLGMPVAPGRYSQRMTQWGVGWARVALEGPDAQAGPVQIADLVRKCHGQRLEVVGEYSSVGDAGPPPVSRHSIVPVSRLAEWLEAPKRAVAGGARSGLVVRLSENSDPLDQIALLTGGGEGDRTRAFEWALPGLPLPEDAEPQLERLGDLVPPDTKLFWWERGLHLAPTTNLPVGMRVERVGEAPGAVRRAPLDPALEASELVRGLAVRLWHGFDRIALATYPFQAGDPVGGGSPGRRAPLAAAFAEYDHSPKPVLAALDFAAEMLNEAVGVDWIDGWRQARALCFERPGGGGVALVWRPLGTTASLHRLVGLGPLLAKPGQPVENAIEVRNCFGQPEPCRLVGQDLIVPVSSMVLFISARGEAWPQLRQALSRALSGPDEGLSPQRGTDLSAAPR